MVWLTVVAADPSILAVGTGSQVVGAAVCAVCQTALGTIAGHCIHDDGDGRVGGEIASSYRLSSCEEVG